MSTTRTPRGAWRRRHHSRRPSQRAGCSAHPVDRRAGVRGEGAVGGRPRRRRHRALLDGAPFGSVHIVALERNARDEFESWRAVTTAGGERAAGSAPRARRRRVHLGQHCWRTNSSRRHSPISSASTTRVREIAPPLARAPAVAQVGGLAYRPRGAPHPNLRPPCRKSHHFNYPPRPRAGGDARIFDFRSRGRLDQTYEDEALNSTLRGQKFLNGRRTGAPIRPPPPRFRLPVSYRSAPRTFGVKHTSGYSDRREKLCRLIDSIRTSYLTEPILVAYDDTRRTKLGANVRRARRRVCPPRSTRRAERGRNAIVRRAQTSL